MKKIAAFILIGLFLGFLVFVYAQQEAKEMKVDPTKELAKSIENGKKLFNDKSLGTSGMNCNSCHMEGGTKKGKMGEMVILPWSNLASQYPKYWGMAKRVVTLDQAVNICIANALKGKPLAWDDQKLTDLTAYCASVKTEETK
ncbi:MAG: c-type cytochrome [Candidatus Aminicenantaceae bacterium]